jgi:glycosyltransferase involved in cell wall biosynthesis
MRPILIDVTRLLRRASRGRLPTGVDRVSLAYVGHFADRARAVVRFGGRCRVLPPAESRRLFARLLDPAYSFEWTGRLLLWRTLLHTGGDAHHPGAFLFNTGHSGLEHATYPGQLRRKGVKPLFMVHDLIPMAHPEYCRPGAAAQHAVRMDTVLRLAHGVVTNSEATLRELESHAKQVKLPMPPAAVSPLAPPRLPPPLPAAPMASPYFVAVGTIEPRKNHWLLLQLWRRLIERLGKSAPKLVVIGQRGWECENVVDLLERCGTLRGHVREISDCSDTQLSTYLYHARALLFPSFAEGYGLPLMEALSLGVPAIASRLPVFREIAGDIPEYLDPLDGMGWMAAVEAYTERDSPARAAQLERLQGFVAPTWETHFDILERFMERLA